MSVALPLRPPPMTARAGASTRFGVAAGPRFFLLLAAGFAWLAPALVDSRFMYGMVAWDVLVVALWLVDVWRLPSPGQLVLRRSWTAPSALSVPSSVELTMINESARPLRVLIVDEVPASLRRDPPSVWSPVAAHAEASTEYGILPTRRGEERLGDAYVRYRSGLQVGERWARASLGQRIITYPNLDEAKRESVRLSRGRQHDVEPRSRALRGAGRSFESLREHQDGDDVRDVCWTASARRGRLVVKRYEIEKSQPILVVVDTGRLMRARVGGLTKLDLAVNAALTLSQVALASGDRVGLLTYGRRIGGYLPAAHGAAHLRQIVEQLAVVRADESEADHLRAAGRVLADQKRRALIVWLTDLPDTLMTPDVIEAASQLMFRHLVLFIAIGQPDLQQVATGRPASIEGMYRAAAAQEVAYRRDLLLARLRASGALAMETSERLSPTLVSAYLEVKQRGRL